MKKMLIGMLAVAFVAVTVARAEEAAAPAKEPAKAEAKCAMEGGKCALAEKDSKCLAIKDGKALCCPCAAACKCTLKEGDATKCSCDKEVKTCDLKGKFVCEKCAVVADKAGKCAKCEADLKLVE
jgi:hypothetical protein